MSRPPVSLDKIKNVSSRQQAPGPQGWQALKLMPAMQRDSLRTLLKLTQEYGDIVRFQLLAWPLYLITHPDHIKYILQERYLQYDKDIFNYRLLKRFLGNGLLTNEGTFWLSQRRLIQPAFHRQHIATFGTLMTEATITRMQHWQASAQCDAPLDIAAEMMRLTLHIVCQALFSTVLDEEADAIDTAFTLVNRHIAQHAFSPLLPLNLPTPGNRRFKTAVCALDSIVNGIIRQRRDRQEERSDLLALLLQAQDEETEEHMNDQQIHDEVMTLLLAGHETTANTLSWTWYLLSQHPEVEHRLHQELVAVLDQRIPTVADLPELKYTRMVIEEAMRLYPPSWVISRNAAKADQIGGYAIPAHAPLLLLPYITHRHPAFWDQPEKFDPDRFTPEQVKSRPRYAYVPFGGGPRQCIGNVFAMTEAQLILATIAQRYRLELVSGQVVSPEPLITLRPNSLLMRLQGR